MVMKGETMLNKLPTTYCLSKCDECGRTLILEVLCSAAGYYIGTECDCGPYSRESGYFATREETQAILNNLMEVFRKAISKAKTEEMETL